MQRLPLSKPHRYSTMRVGVILRGILAINWLCIGAAVTIISALSSIVTPHIWPDTPFYAAVEQSGLWINLGIYGLPILLSVTVAARWPRQWRPTLVLAAILPLPLGAASSGRFIALLVVMAILIPVCWAGRELVGQIFSSADRATIWALGMAVGIIIIGVTGFILGLLGLLRPLILWPLLLATVSGLTLSSARTRLIGDLAAAARALRQPIVFTPTRVLLAGLLVATMWTVILGALAPETASDTVRQRTPAALNFAHTRHLDPGTPPIQVALAPAIGEVTYAVVLALGPIPGAKLLALLIGGICVSLVAALGKRLGGHRAGNLAAFSFATIPLVVWLSQTAYLDLLTCLAALAGALFLLTLRRPDRAATIACGLCCGWGIAIKFHVAYVAVGLGVTMLLLVFSAAGTWTARIRRALVLSLLCGASAVIILLPPLLHSAALNQQFPRLSMVTRVSGHAANNDSATAAQDYVNKFGQAKLNNLTKFGYGRDLQNLLLLPLDLTVHSLQFEWVPTPWGPFNGLLGYLPLALLPLLVLARPDRRTAALWWGAAIAGLGWFYSAQYLRYGLPIVALLCPIGAVAFERVRRNYSTPNSRRLLAVLFLIPALAGVIIQARVPAYSLDFVLGRESETAYLNHNLFCCGGTAVLQLLDAQPDAIRALSLSEIPLLYEHTPVSTELAAPIGVPAVDLTDPLAVLNALDTNGYTHLIIARRYLTAGWERSQLVSEDFLRRYTVLIGNSSDTYLYRILPPTQRDAPVSWTKGTELLANGDFEAMSGDGIPAAWIPFHGDGKRGNAADAAATLPRYERDGNAASGSGAVLIGRDDGWETTVPVRAGQRYVLDAASRGATTVGGSGGGFALRIEWRDTNSQPVGKAIARVPTSTIAYHHFSSAATAPPGASTVTVILLALDTNVWIDDVSLREATGGVDLGAMP